MLGYIAAACIFFGLAGVLYYAMRRYRSTDIRIVIIAVLCVILGFVLIGLPLFNS